MIHKRQKIFANDLHIDTLRSSFKYVMKNHPFRMDAYVIMPDHIHCIWTLPDGDHDFSTKWRLIKSHFTRDYNGGSLKRSPWQKKFWEHTIRDEKDLKHHVDYIHYNPVKHGLVKLPTEWVLSSIHRYILEGVYPPDWGASESLSWDNTVGRE